MGEKKGTNLMFFRDPPFGYHFGVILGVFLSIWGGFWYHLGRLRRVILVMFSFAFCSLAVGLSQDVGGNFESCVALAPLCSSALLVCPGVLWFLVSLTPVYERSVRSD